jgi:hypothetical protein
MDRELWSSLNPGLDCLARGGCLMVEHRQGVAWARWCLWCGGGVSNEHEAGWGSGGPGEGESI